jgi:bifunctional ADP-heptose synthase (sugar kinase/adenylyltransferase)
MPAPRVPDFGALSVLVVGDLIADQWLYAQPRRLSREAPVMVLRH